jgi:hypothetical protein
MSHLAEIERKMNVEKNRIGLVAGTVKLKEYDKAKQEISAHISPFGWNAEVAVAKGFQAIKDKRQAAYARRKKITDGLETMLLTLAGHEFGHWALPFESEKGCPYDTYNHDKILEAVKQNLPQDKQMQAGYVANAFEDVIDNARLKEWSGNIDGLVLFWDHEGLKDKRILQRGYTPFYEAFVKLNVFLSGDNVDYALLKRHFKNPTNIDYALMKIATEWHLQTDEHGKPKPLKSTVQLFRKKLWPEMAAIFTKYLAEFLDIPPTESLSANSDGSEGDNNDSGNGVEEKAKTRDGKEEISYGRYSNNETQSTNLTRYDQLDALYRKLARPLSVKVEAMARNQGLNVADLTYRPFNAETDSLNLIKLTRLFITDQGLMFGYPDEPLMINAKSKFQRKGFPSFKLIMLDNSGSMASAIDAGGIGQQSFIPWGNNSKYHYALLGFYGIEQYLQQQGIAQYIQHGLSLFSDQTRYKEAGFAGIDEVRKLALAPQFGNTHLDINILETALRGKESFVMSLSDGEISGWSSYKSRFIALAKQNYYIHIQIGPKSQFSNDLEAARIPVIPVSSGADLAKAMVDTTKTVYSRFLMM